MPKIENIIWKCIAIKHQIKEVTLTRKVTTQKCHTQTQHLTTWYTIRIQAKHLGSEIDE